MTDQDKLDGLRVTASRIETKIDKLDDKIDGHGEQLARHEVRLAALERAAQRTWERAGLWIATGLALLAEFVLPHIK